MSAMRLCIAWVLVVAALAAALASWLVLRSDSRGDPDQARFLRWETCVLNGGPWCGPQPVP